MSERERERETAKNYKTKTVGSVVVEIVVIVAGVTVAVDITAVVVIGAVSIVERTRKRLHS